MMKPQKRSKAYTINSVEVPFSVTKKMNHSRGLLLLFIKHLEDTSYIPANSQMYFAKSELYLMHKEWSLNKRICR